MNVVAKFKVTGKEVVGEGDDATWSIKAEPVIGGCPENDEFFKYTPGGSLSIDVVSESAAGFFVEGEEFYLKFYKSRT